MHSYSRIVAAAASIVTALALTGCGETYVSDTSTTDANATVAAQRGRLEAWPNNYSYSRPEGTVIVPQPAGAQIPANAGSSQLDLGPTLRPAEGVGAQPSK